MCHDSYCCIESFVHILGHPEKYDNWVHCFRTGRP
jgi:hypothetical protein